MATAHEPTQGYYLQLKLTLSYYLVTKGRLLEVLKMFKGLECCHSSFHSLGLPSGQQFWNVSTDNLCFHFDSEVKAKILLSFSIYSHTVCNLYRSSAFLERKSLFTYLILCNIFFTKSYPPKPIASDSDNCRQFVNVQSQCLF